MNFWKDSVTPNHREYKTSMRNWLERTTELLVTNPDIPITCTELHSFTLTYSFTYHGIEVGSHIFDDLVHGITVKNGKVELLKLYPSELECEPDLVKEYSLAVLHNYNSQSQARQTKNINTSLELLKL